MILIGKKPEGIQGVDYSDKVGYRWISVIRLPDFVTEADFRWAVETATKKKSSTVRRRSF